MHAFSRQTDRRTYRRTGRILVAGPRLHFMQRGNEKCVVGHSGRACEVADDAPANLNGIKPCCSPGYDSNLGERRCEIVPMSVNNVAGGFKCRSVNKVCILLII